MIHYIICKSVNSGSRQFTWLGLLLPALPPYSLVLYFTVIPTTSLSTRVACFRPAFFSRLQTSQVVSSTGNVCRKCFNMFAFHTVGAGLEPYSRLHTVPTNVIKHAVTIFDTSPNWAGLRAICTHVFRPPSANPAFAGGTVLCGTSSFLPSMRGKRLVRRAEEIWTPALLCWNGIVVSPLSLSFLVLSSTLSSEMVVSDALFSCNLFVARLVWFSRLFRKHLLLQS